MEKINFDQLDALAADWMLQRKAHLQREKGFIYRHCKRVSVSILQLRRHTTGDAGHDTALRVAAMFHDIGKGIEPHEETGAAIVQSMLSPHLPPALLTEVVHLIRSHKAYAISDPWAHLLQDADILDHFGTIEIGLSFQYSAYNEKGMPETLDWYERHYDRELERIRALLHHRVSQEILDEKAAYTRAFAARLASEMAGDYPSLAHPITPGSESRA